MKTEFEIVGYSKDIYVDRKFMGSIRLEKPDRETFGYHGRKTEILEADLIIKKKKIKAGTEIVSELFPLNGNVKNNPFKNVKK